MSMFLDEFSRKKKNESFTIPLRQFEDLTNEVNTKPIDFSDMANSICLSIPCYGFAAVTK